MNNINQFYTEMEKRAYRQGIIDGKEQAKKELMLELNELEKTIITNIKKLKDEQIQF